MPETYTHKEAFCVMNYVCEGCGSWEKLWNSRDGVTPFIINCLKCGRSARHMHWNLDRLEPDFKPTIGSRIFIDMTLERALELAIDGLKRFKAAYDAEPDKFPLGSDLPDPTELAKEYYGAGSQPDIKTIEDVPEPCGNVFSDDDGAYRCSLPGNHEGPHYYDHPLERAPYEKPSSTMAVVVRSETYLDFILVTPANEIFIGARPLAEIMRGFEPGPVRIVIEKMGRE